MGHPRNRWKYVEILSIVLVTVFVISVILDVRPPETTVEIPVGLVIWINEPSPSVDNVDVRITLYLRCTGTLVAMKKVNLSGYGKILSPDAMNITYVAVGLRTSLAYPARNDSSGFPESKVLSLNKVGSFLLEDNADVYFPVSGDFEASCVVHVGMETMSGTFSLPNVHVEPESELTAERLNRLTLGLTLAFVFFGFIELAYLYVDHKDRGEDKLKPILSEFEKILQKLEKIDQNTKQATNNQESQSDETKPKPQKRQAVREQT